MRVAFLIIVILASVHATGISSAAEVTWDLLAGIGDFESCNIVHWWSTYNGPDFDFEAINRSGGYASPPS